MAMLGLAGGGSLVPGAVVLRPFRSLTRTVVVDRRVRPGLGPYTKTLNDTVPAGKTASVSWIVPATATGQSFAVSKIVLAAGHGSGGNGSIVLKEGQQGGYLAPMLNVAIHLVSSKPSSTTVTSPFYFSSYPAPAKPSVVSLTVTCATKQPACNVSSTLSGQLISIFSVPNGSWWGDSNWVAPPGTSHAVIGGSVPSGHTGSITDIILTSPGGGDGTVKYEIVPPTGKPVTILSTTISKLTAAPLDYRPTKAIIAPAKSNLELVITCPANQHPCGANSLFSGKLT